MERINPGFGSSQPKRASLAGDVSNQVLIQFLIRGVSAITSILLARHLTKAENGYLAVAWNYIQYAQFLTDLGFNTLLVREAANASSLQRRHLIWTSLRARFALAILIALAVLLVSFFDSSKQMAFLLRTMVCPILIAAMLSTWVEGVMIATERVALAARFNLVWAVGNVAVTAITLILHLRLRDYLLMQLIVQWLLALAGVAWVLGNYPWSAKFEQRMLRSVWAFGAAGFFRETVNAMPLLIFPHMPLGTRTILPEDEQKGLIAAYSNGYKFSSVLLALPGGISKAFFTRMCKAWEAQNHQEHATLVLTALRVGGTLGAVLSIGLCVISSELIFLIFKDKFPLSTNTTLAITAFVPWVHLLSAPLGDALSSTPRYALRTKMLAYLSVIALLIYLTIPRIYGVEGAAASVLLVEVVLVSLLWSCLPSQLRPSAAQQILKQLLLMVLATALGWWLKGLLLPHMLPILAAFGSGVLAVLVFAGVTLIFDEPLRRTVLRQKQP